MDPMWSETCWGTFKYFIILIVSTYYILCISWIIVFENYLILKKNWVISGKHNCSRCYQQRSEGSVGWEGCPLIRGEILWTNCSYKYKRINDVLQWRNLWPSRSMYKASFQHNFVWSHNQILCLHVFASLIIFLHTAIKCSSDGHCSLPST
jgi:hypothetical protein